MRIAQEEIFGPVVVIMPYEGEEDAIRIANATVYGLSSHVQSATQESARRVARQIRAGQVHINYPHGRATRRSVAIANRAMAAIMGSLAWKNISR